MSFACQPPGHQLGARMGGVAAGLAITKVVLVRGWFEQPECFKYRSLQLTGDEKRLEALAWLVGTGHMEIRVVLPTDKNGTPLPATQTGSVGTFSLNGGTLTGGGSIGYGEGMVRFLMEAMPDVKFLTYQLGQYADMREVIARSRVYVRFTDGAGNTSIVNDSIVLDTAAPTVSDCSTC